MHSNHHIIQREMWRNGPAPGQFYNFTGGNNNIKALKEYTTPGMNGTQHAATPIVTGTTVLGVVFDKGVMIAADNLISYGTLARFRDVKRVFDINDKTILGAGVDYADFQSLKRIIDQKVIEDTCYDDSITLDPKAMHNWLTRVLYNRRSRMDPLFVELVVGGISEGKPYLGHVDLRGRSYTDKILATGLGQHLALPLMRAELVGKPPVNEEFARKLIQRCMEVLYYRDCRALSEYSLAICTDAGSVVEGPFKVNENWVVGTMVRGYN